MEDRRQRTAELFRAARAGDEPSRRALLQRHSASIRRLLRARMGDGVRERAESVDLAQDVLLDLLANLDVSRFGSEADLDRYLAIVVRNKVAATSRKKGESGNDASIDQVSAPFARQETSPLERAARNERRSRLIEALKDLSAEQRRVIELRDLEQRSFAEIAKVTGKSEAAAQMLHHRGWMRLTVLLRDRDDEAPRARR